MRLSGFPERSPTVWLFEQLVSAFGPMSGVALGRRFGCWCIKLGRYPFIALNGDQIAFRVGFEASALAEQLPQARLWNPRNGRQAKQCWVADSTGNLESIATLGAIAYRRAALATARTKADGASE
jgi:hypothetical protein